MIYHRRSETDNDDEYYNLDGLKEEVNKTVRDLKPHLDKFDGIIVRGMSGVVTGVPVSLRLDKHLFIVRKDDDDCHAFTKVINAGKAKPGTRWIFLDDFVSSGETRQRCINELVARQARMVGQYVTDGHNLYWHDFTENDYLYQ